MAGRAVALRSSHNVANFAIPELRNVGTHLRESREPFCRRRENGAKHGEKAFLGFSDQVEMALRPLAMRIK